MKITRAIDRFLAQMQLENDWTARTVASVYAALKLIDQEHPDANLADFDGRPGLEKIRALIGNRWGRAAASTRATRISYFHTFFQWAETEGYIDDDQVRKIKRPPARKPDTYKPTETEIELLLAAATPLELAPLLLMSGAGLRASELVATTWDDLDLLDSKARVRRKGHNWQWLPIDPLVVELLRGIYRDQAPAGDDHIYVAETEQWESNEHRIRKLIDPKTPRTPKALWSMVNRVSVRAGIHPLGPHMLRRGFANSFLRATRDEFGTADVWTLKLLMGHSRIDTTEKYLKDLETEEAADVFRRLRSPADDPTLSQASPDETTDTGDDPGVAQSLEWRRRESNPRPRRSKPGSRAGSDSDDSEPPLTDREGGHK